MKKNNGILTIIILLLCLIFATLDKALAENNLVRLDLKKGSGNSVDITFFTSENYDGNVIVRKKSDNKYVILMPKVLTSGYRRTDLESVSSLVSNIDVKSINDGAAGYTKITMITTKPLNITTHTEKSIPLTDGQKQYQTLIAEAHTLKNNSTETKQQTQNTNITGNNNQTAQNIEKQTQEIKPQTSPNIKTQPKISSDINTLPKKSTVTKKQTAVLKEPSNKSDGSIKKPETPTAEKLQTAAVTEVIEKPVVSTVQDDIITEEILQETKGNTNIAEFTSANVSIMQRVKNKVHRLTEKTKQKMPALTAVLLIILIPAVALIVLVKFVNTSLQAAKVMKKTFLGRHISTKNNRNNYAHIINDDNLNWQEKYQMYINQTEEEEEEEEEEEKVPVNKYKFIQKTQDTVEEQRKKLEQLITPENIHETYDAPINSDALPVFKDEDAIAETLKNAVKIKAFEPSLNKTRRSDKKFKKSRFTGFEISNDKKNSVEVTPVIEVQPKIQKTIKMKKTTLSTNPLNLNKKDMTFSNVNKDDYIMSSLEEFFAVKEKSVAETLAQIKPSMKMKRPQISPLRGISNPISTSKAALQVPPAFSGLIVKTGCNIDENRGFYIVNLDGTLALIGRIKDEIFVLKKFDDASDKHLQVRHDKENIYMVKTEGFKSLVNVDDMGVLIEL